MAYVVLILLGIFVCVSALPVVWCIYLNISNKKEETIYEFSKEMIEADYPDANFFEMKQEEFQKRKQQVFSQKLP